MFQNFLPEIQQSQSLETTFYLSSIGILDTFCLLLTICWLIQESANSILMGDSRC
jgi:hypothetical protein